MKIWLLALLIPPLLMAVLQVKAPCTLTIIARGAPLVLIVVAGHGGCDNIFGIWNNKFLSNPIRKIIYRILGWFPTIAIFPLTLSLY